MPDESPDAVRVAYFDTSALAKLIRPEGETLALRTAIISEPWQVIVSSSIAITEVARGIARSDDSPDARLVASRFSAARG